MSAHHSKKKTRISASAQMVLLREEQHVIKHKP